MKTQILEKLNDLKVKSGKSYEQIHDDLGFATSTVHRWHKGESTPDIDDLTTLVEYYGGSMTDLFAAVGKQEMTATQDIGYQGANVMVEHYEARLKAKDDLFAREREHYNSVTNYLKAEIDRLRDERDSARNTSLEVVWKKHRVFSALVVICIVMGIAISLLIVLLIVAFKTDAII